MIATYPGGSRRGCAVALAPLVLAIRLQGPMAGCPHADDITVPVLVVAERTVLQQIG